MKNLDHPLIILFHVATAVALFKLFFTVRKNPFPMPHATGLLAFVVTVAAASRAGHKDYFFITAIVQYAMWFLSTVAVIYAVQHTQTAVKKLRGAEVIIPDRLDKVQNKIVWALGILALGFVVVDYIKTYNQKQHAEAQNTETALKVYASATEHYTEQQAQTISKLDTALAAVTSISAAQGTVLNKLDRSKTDILHGQQNLAKDVAKTKAEVRKTIQSTVIDARTIAPKKPKAEPANRNFYQRLKDMIHARTDTSASVSAPDTLAYFN